MTKHSKTRLTQMGFSLVEMAVVLAIVALLLGGLLPTLSGQVEKQRRNETQKYMSEVRDALLGYAVANGRLPCPDTNGDGLENTPCKALNTQQFGTLPYQDLGVANKDAYGNVLAYGVTKAFADTAPLFTLTTLGVMDVCTSQACTTLLANNVVAVIASSGVKATSVDEAENLNNTNNNFVSHDLVQNGFDDLVVWLSPNTLFNRMVAAGKLP
jgi:prepilin-type N-terminal cleavage/methylation domain-containing protein